MENKRIQKTRPKFQILITPNSSNYLICEFNEDDLLGGYFKVRRLLEKKDIPLCQCHVTLYIHDEKGQHLIFKNVNAYDVCRL